MEYSYGNRSTNTTASNQGSPGLDMREERARMAAAAEEVKKELQEYWKKEYSTAEIFPVSVAAMHPGVVDFLLSFNLVSVYDNIAKQSGLDAKGRNILPRAVWQVAQNKNWDSLDQVLKSQIPLADNIHSQIVQLLAQNIISKLREISEKPFARKTASETGAKREIILPISQALQQYPKLGEQDITNNPLKLRYFQNSVRPSLKNWVTDFHDNMGAGKHGAIDRGNYLFHSENGKKLTPIERQKISMILKSLDEQTPLRIDAESQSIVFPNMEQLTASRPVPIQQSFPLGQNGQHDVFASQDRQTMEKNIKTGEAAKISNAHPNLVQYPNVPQNKNQAEADPRNFFTNPKNENLKKFATVEHDYFQIPKTQPRTDFTPKPDAAWSVKPQLGRDNPSDDLKGSTIAHFSPELKQNNREDSSATVGKLSFSSPQKLPVEQDMDVMDKKDNLVEEQKVTIPSPPKIDEIPKPQKQTVQQSQWIIKPSSYFNEESDSEDKLAQPKINKNVVDLRN